MTSSVTSSTQTIISK